MTKYLTDFIVTTHGAGLALADDQSKNKFWKMVMGYGEFVDPNNTSDKMILNKSVADDMVSNFISGPITSLPVPLGHPETSGELADQTRGWVDKLEARDDGLYALLSIDEPNTASKIENGLIKDTSVAFDKEYLDKRSGKVLKNVLRHIGLVNDPYIKGMKQFEPALGDASASTMLFSEGSTNNLTKENTMDPVTITNDRDFDVEIKYTESDEPKDVIVKAGETVEVPADVAEDVKTQIANAVKTEDNTDNEDLSDKEKKLADERAAFEAEKAKFEADRTKSESEAKAKAAESKFSDLLKDGKVVPAQKDAFMALSTKIEAQVKLSDDKTTTTDELLSEFFENAPQRRLKDEAGANGSGSGDDIDLTEDEKSLTELGLTEDEIKETKKQEGEK